MSLSAQTILWFYDLQSFSFCHYVLGSSVIWEEGVLDNWFFPPLVLLSVSAFPRFFKATASHLFYKKKRGRDTDIISNLRIAKQVSVLVVHCQAV